MSFAVTFTMKNDGCASDIRCDRVVTEWGKGEGKERGGFIILLNLLSH